MVFQGTVLGSHLSLIYFADVAAVKPDDNSWEIFADDFSAAGGFPDGTSDRHVFCNLQEVKDRVHHWRARNRKGWDPAREATVILDSALGAAQAFRFLGTGVDNRRLTALQSPLARPFLPVRSSCVSGNRISGARRRRSPPRFAKWPRVGCLELTRCRRRFLIGRKGASSSYTTSTGTIPTCSDHN